MEHKKTLKFHKFMNSLEASIKFTVEVQQTNKISLLDVMIERQDSLLISYVYHKPTDTGLYLKWTSNQPKQYKINLIKCLCNRAVKLCSSELLLRNELDHYRKTFLANGYPPDVIKKRMRKFVLNKNKNNNNMQQATNVETIFISMRHYCDYSIT